MIIIQPAPDHSYKGILFVDGVLVEQSVYANLGVGDAWIVHVYDDAAEIVAAQRFSDIPINISFLELRESSEPRKGDLIRRSFVIDRDDSGTLNNKIVCRFNIAGWKYLWSMYEYLDEFRLILQREQFHAGVWENVMEPDGTPRFSVSFPVEDVEATMKTVALKHEATMQELHRLTEASLMAKLRSNSVVMQFDFPEEVKVPCEQYLLYFVQFLKDLGVEATAELQHEAGYILFAVTPTDKETALDKIRAALEIYLRLSANPISDSSALDNEIAIQRLVGEIQGLQSRLTLARAEIQFKDKTIEAQQFIIDRQRLSGDVMLESLKNVTPQPPKEDKEAVLGGIVEITKYEGKGVNVNFAEIFRRLKKYLAKR